MFLMYSTTFESFDCFLSLFPWPPCDEAEALSFSLMRDDVSYDDMDDLDSRGVFESRLVWVSAVLADIIIFDMASWVVMVKGRGMVAMVA